MSDSLREALEKLADDFDGKPHGGAVAYTGATRILRDLLAAHPVAPRPVVDREALENRMTDALICADELMAPGYSARIEADADDVARVAADAVLALINGTES